MKHIIILFASVLIGIEVSGQVATSLSKKPDPNKKTYLVNASCGECNFGMEGNDCDLAVQFNGSNYFVDGVGIMEYGHPHDKNGFCLVVRKAEVQGEVVNGRFKATYFKLLDPKEGKKK